MSTGVLSNFAELELIDHLFKVGSYTAPSLYLAYSTADPGETGGTISEPAGNNYSRTQYTGGWSTASSRASSNSAAITCATSSGSQGTITHWAFFDAASSGNMIMYGALDSSVSITSGRALRIAAGDLDISWAAGGLSDYAANELLDHLLGVGAYTPPTNIYVGLSTADPTDDGSGIAENSDGYARVNNNTWDTASSGATANTNEIAFSAATGTWTEVTHFFASDASSSGNMLCYAALDTARTVASGEVARFAAGDFDFTMN